MNTMYKIDNGWVMLRDIRRGVTTHIFRGGLRCVFSGRGSSVALICRDRVVDVFPSDFPPDDHVRLLLEMRRIARGRRSMRSKARSLKRLRHILLN